MATFNGRLLNLVILVAQHPFMHASHGLNPNITALGRIRTKNHCPLWKHDFDAVKMMLGLWANLQNVEDFTKRDNFRCNVLLYVTKYKILNFFDVDGYKIQKYGSVPSFPVNNEHASTPMWLIYPSHSKLKTLL
jgi:hypothetical protein